MSAGPGDDAVVVEIPASHRFTPAVRVAAASVAAELDPDVDQVEDLRLAVSELVGLLVASADAGSRIRVQMRLVDGSVEVVGHATSGSAPPEPDDLTRRLLEATVDTFGSGPGRTFALSKRLGRA
jgi:serine/threonine-protein kinase RsbW